MAFLWLKKIDEHGTGRKNKRPRITLCPAVFPLHPQNRTGISIYEKLEGGKQKKEIRILILVKSHQMPKWELVGMKRVGHNHMGNSMEQKCFIWKKPKAFYFSSVCLTILCFNKMYFHLDCA